MFQQRNKFQIITIISLCLAVFSVGLFIFKSSVVYLFLSCYLLIISIISDSLLLHVTFQKHESIKQLLRGITLLLAVTFLLFYLLRR